MSASQLDQALGLPRPRNGASSADLLTTLCSPRVAYIAMAIVVLVIFPWSIQRAVNDGGCDLQDFCISGQYVLDHGARMPEIVNADGYIEQSATCLARYLPSVDVAFIPLALLPLPLTAALWYCMNVACWYGLLRTVRRELLTIEDQGVRERGSLAAALLMFPVALDGFLLGSFHLLVIWLMVAGLTNVWRGRGVRGGLLLGVGVWLKLLPIVGVGYLLLKRKWSAAAVALACALTIDVALSMAAFGWNAGWQEHRLWLDQGAVGTAARQMDENKANDEDRITNQSTLVVVRRLFNARAGFSKLTLLDLSPTALAVMELGVLATMGLGVLWLLRSPAMALRPEDWAAEISIVLLTTLWFSPVVWSYHFTAALPAIALLMARKDHEASKRLTACVWILALVCFTIPLARAAGHMLWATFFIGGQVALATWWRPQVTADAARDRANASPQRSPRQTVA